MSGLSDGRKLLGGGGGGGVIELGGGKGKKR